MIKELDYYPILAEKLKPEKIRAYYGKDFNTVGHRKRFDMLLFHESTNLPSPIGLEVKLGSHFHQITKGIIEQISGKYKDKKFKCDKENWEGIPQLLAFTTITACEGGIIYGKHYPEASNFFVERICWALHAALLTKNLIQNKFVISYKNKRYCFDNSYIPILGWED